MKRRPPGPGDGSEGYQVHVPSLLWTILPTEGAGGRAAAVAAADEEGADAALSEGAGATLAAVLATGVVPTSTVGVAGGCVALLSHPAAKVTTKDAARAFLEDFIDQEPYASMGGQVHTR